MVNFSHETMIPFIREADNLMVLKTLSKGYSLAGIRVGYALANDKLIKALKKVLDPYNVSFLSQKIALLALKHEKHFKENNQKIIATRESFLKKITEMNFSSLSSSTNFILTSPPGKTIKNRKAVAEKLFFFLRENNILVRYFPYKQLASYLRITIGTDKQMDKVCKSIKKFISS